MSRNYALKATKRDRAGKGVARALRREGEIPAVIYGDKKDPITISIPSNDINVEYNKGHMYVTLCDLEVDGEKHVVLARDVQVHPVTDFVLHADFLRVTAKTKIVVEVPVQLLNEEECPGLKDGGVLNLIRHEVGLVCSAMNIPETLDVDMSGAEIGDTLKISDVTLPDGVTPEIDDRDFSIVTIAAPRKIEVIEEEEAAEGEDGEGAEEGAEGEGSEEGASEGDASGEESSE